ncbi:MAG: hypothetical protein Kow0063_09050 [Anaerolineae bacterium]
MKQLRVILVGLAILSVSGLAPPVWQAFASAPPGLEMEAWAAYDGHFKYGEWLPVWVQVENSGPDLEAEIQVHVTGSWGQTSFAVPAPLPGGSRKLIPVYVLPNNYTHVLQVELVADDGEVLLSQKVPVQPQPNITYQVGLLAPERGALSLLLGVPLPGQERPKTLVDLSLADLPERPEGLRSFDTLILNDMDTSSLTPEQKSALEAWVQQGGRLVIGGGAGAQHTTAGLPQSILPLLPRGEMELSRLPALADFAGGEPVRVPGPFVVASGEEGEGSTLVAQDGLPLIIERVVGAGYVDFVALDLAVSPFDAWAGTTAFWERLLAPGAAYPEWLPPDMSARQVRSGQMTYALSRLPALELPSIRGLGLLLVLYVALVGPVNYLVLRWRKRLHWAWVSIPLITLVFSAGAFGVGYTMRGTDLILNKIAVLELDSSGTARVTSYLGLFSPARQSYEIEVRNNALLSPLTPDYNPWGPSAIGTGAEIVFVQGEPGYVRGLAVDQWSMQTFMMEGVWEDFGQIQADLQLEDGSLAGTIHNQTAHTLRDVVLILGNNFKRLDDLEPGQEVDVTLDLTSPLDLALGQPLSFLLYEDQFTQPGPGAPSREAELKRAVIDGVFNQSGPVSIWSSRMARGPWRGLTLLGWLDQAPPEVRVAGRTPAQQTTALFYLPLSFHMPQEGNISLPPGLIPGALVVMPVEGGPCGPNGTSLWLGRGEAVFEFQAPQGIQVDELRLVISSDGAGWWQLPETAIYDYTLETWATLEEPITGINVIPDAGGMVNDHGQVRVRLSSAGNQVGCLHLELGLEGRRSSQP